MVVLTLDSFIRHMPHRAFVKLSCLLDPGGLWENMASGIPLKLEDINDEDAQRRYTHQQVAVFALMGQRAGSGNSPTQRVLMDWGTKNARICHLVQILMRAELYAAANYLHDDLLQLGPVTQPEADLPPPALSKPDSSDDSQHGSTDKTHDPEDKEKLNAVADRAGGGVARMEAAPCEEMSDLLLEDLATISDRMSYYSSHHGSVMNQAGLQLSQLQRQDSVSYEDSEEAWIGLRDIELQMIAYNMLGSVTNNFDERPLEKGGSLIGSGGFGMVYLGKFHNGFKIAVKYLKQTEQMKKEELIKQFENEVKTLSTYRHDNVVHLLGYSIDGPSQCLVYQYLPNGSLEDRLARHQGTPPLSANMRLKIVKGTANGIQYLNDNGYVHRDIKSANILLDSEFTAKVGDFATVVSAPSGDSKTIAQASVVIGTPAYLAPEALSFDISTKLDSYSFGVVLLEVITGLAAQDTSREECTLSSHIMENVEEPSEIHDYVDQSAGGWGEGVIDKLYDISFRCLTHLKKRRPNVRDIRPDLEEM